MVDSDEKLIRELVQATRKKLGAKDISVGDFIKLLHLQRELEAEEIKEIEVRWVES
jgi:hypothetical protein